MAKHAKNGRSAGERYLALRHYLLRSAAWLDLDCTARCTYIEIARRYTGSNNGRISCSLREIAEALRIGKATAKRALERLQDHGFLVLTERGAFSLKVRHASTWRLTEHKDDVTGALPSKEFARWQEQNTVPPQNPHGFQDETDRVSP